MVQKLHEIAYSDTEWAVELDGGKDGVLVIIRDDEEDARLMAAMTATGKVLCREVYYAEWCEVE